MKGVVAGQVMVFVPLAFKVALVVILMEVALIEEPS